MKAEITARNIERVLAFLSVFEDSEARLYEIETKVLTMDPYRYADVVYRFVDTLYREGFVVPFDWPAWQEQAQQLMDDPALLVSVDLATLQKLLTTHVRAERFTSGHLAQIIDSGHLRAILRRLQAIHAGMAAGQPA